MTTEAAMLNWITDRLPTEKDGDSDGEVLIPWQQGDTPADAEQWQHYSWVVPEQPWISHAAVFEAQP